MGQELTFKFLTVIHGFAEKAGMVTDMSTNGAMDAMLTALSLFTRSTAMGYVFASAFSWIWQIFYHPNPQHAAVHDQSLRLAMEADRYSFNDDSCQGKVHGDE